jgi:hypothetical protein
MGLRMSLSFDIIGDGERIDHRRVEMTRRKYCNYGVFIFIFPGFIKRPDCVFWGQPTNHDGVNPVLEFARTGISLQAILVEIGD